ncbi:SCO4848 family membrane protein [Bailinhaonella thermotolerans]
MTRGIAAFLLVVAAFMIFEWINLGFNLAPGHKRSFYVVHGILIGVNLLVALALGVVGLRGWRAAGRREEAGPRG